MRHERWLKVCIRLAYQHHNHMYRHVSILVRGGRIVAVGYNRVKPNPMQNPSYVMRTVHSEVDISRQIGYNSYKGAILYVTGLTQANHLVFSKPCQSCQKKIEIYKDYGLRDVYYTTPYGIEKL